MNPLYGTLLVSGENKLLLDQLRRNKQVPVQIIGAIIDAGDGEIEVDGEATTEYTICVGEVKVLDE